MDKANRYRKQLFNRRQFLKGMGAITLVAATGVGIKGFGSLRNGVLAQEGIEITPEEKAKRQWGRIIDLRRCDGCKECVKACIKLYHRHDEQTWIRVYETEGEGALEQTGFVPLQCQHCENPPCVKVCPVTATYKDTDGAVLVDQNKCIGCRMCMAACPYHARYFNWGEPPPYDGFANPRPEWPVPQRRGTVGKCVFCVYRTWHGQLPACVEACPQGVLYMADLVKDLATNGKETVKFSKFIKENDAFRLLEELNTKPRIYFIAGHGQRARITD